MDADLYREARARRQAREPIGGLFDQPEAKRPAEAPHNGSDGSRTAADAVDAQPRGRERTRERIVSALRECGATGATRAEVAANLGISANTVNPRVWELLAEQPPRIAERGTRNGCAVLIHHSEVRPFGAPETTPPTPEATDE